MGDWDTRRRETKDCGLLRDDYRPLGRLFKIIQMCSPWAIPCISSSVSIRLTFSFFSLLLIYNLFNIFFKVMILTVFYTIFLSQFLTWLRSLCLS